MHLAMQSLMRSWNPCIQSGTNAKKVARKLSEDDEPEFFYYFNHSIATDMKRTMLKPVRQSAGLQEKFYFNNAPESMNARLKQRKKAEKSGKMSWPDRISLVESLAQEQERKHRTGYN